MFDKAWPWVRSLEWPGAFGKNQFHGPVSDLMCLEKLRPRKLFKIDPRGIIICIQVWEVLTSQIHLKPKKWVWFFSPISHFSEWSIYYQPIILQMCHWIEAIKNHCQILALNSCSGSIRYFEHILTLENQFLWKSSLLPEKHLQ